MALILSLETSGPLCSVALHDRGRLVASRETSQPQQHASLVAVLIKEVCEVSKIAISDVQAVGISSGPGSYTGLRIGTSTAKGLCYALNIPLISIPTLELLAHEAIRRSNKSDGLFCAMVDAKRMEVYAEVFDSNLNVIQSPQSFVVEASAFEELLTDHRVLFFGDGAEKCKDVIKNKNASFVNGISATASLMGLPAFTRYTEKRFEDLVNFVPFYLKEFVAKRASSPL